MASENPCSAVPERTFAGGFRQSDASLYERILEVLSKEREFAGGQIQFEVVAGVATLSGVVSSFSQKEHVEKAIEGIFGLDDIHNRLRVE